MVKKIINQKVFPENLEERLNSVLNVVNSEIKSVIVFHLDDCYVPIKEIKSRIKRTVGNSVYLPHISTIQSYFRNSLIPVGMVAEEQAINESKEVINFSYRLTDAGKEFGVPIVSSSLEWAVENNISMYDILKSTQSKGKTRSPYNRVSILRKVNKGFNKIMDLAKQLNLAPTLIQESVKELSERGLLKYESIGEFIRGSEKVFYSWNEGKNPQDAKPIGIYNRSPKLIAEMLYQKKVLSIKETAKLIGCNYVTVVGILCGLVDQGLASKGPWKSHERFSKVLLTKIGESYINDYVDPIIESLTNKKALNELHMQKDLLVYSCKYKEYIKNGLTLYTNTSPWINQKPKEKRNKEIIDYIKQNPGKRPAELKKVFQLREICSYLTPLVKMDILKKEKDGKAVRYYIN